MDSTEIRAARNAARRVFVVAGMHRAGTSVVTRGLQALGIDLGDHLMSADQRMNARGFFEDVDVVKCDDALLEMLDADWKSLALLADVDWRTDTFASARSDAQRLLAARLARTGQFGFKDPRVPRLLPFWQAVIAEAGAADAYVIAVRHPLSVIESLTARDGLDVRRSGWLWLTHLLCALHYTAGRSRVVVDYDRVIAAPERELARMARGLGLPPSTQNDAGATSATYASEFVSAALRHAEHAPENLDAGDVPPLVPAVHALAQRLAQDEADPNAAATIADVDALFAQLNAFAPLLAYAATAERAADQVPRLEGELTWARTSQAAAAAYASDLRTTLGAYNEDLLSTLQRKEGELVAAHAKLQRIGAHALGRIVLRWIER
jgi:hypothetical protein